MSANLSFKYHISQIIKKAQAKVNVLFKSIRSSSTDLLLKAFTVYVRPLLETATVVWNPTSVFLVNDLESVQRSFTRRLFYRCRLTPLNYSDRLNHLSLSTLEYRRCLQDFAFIYNCLYSNYSLETSNLYKRAPLSRNLRGSHVLRILLPFPISSTKISTCVSRRIACWNAFSSEVVLSFSCSTFISNLRRLPIQSVQPCSLIRS